VYEVEPGSPFPVRLYAFDTGPESVLGVLLEHYGGLRVADADKGERGEEAEDESALTLLLNRRGRGLTALHVAVMKLRVEAVDALLAAGADPDIRMGSGPQTIVQRALGYVQRKLLALWLGVSLEAYARLMDGGMTARQLALSLDGSVVPNQVRQRGAAEVARYMRRIADMRRRFREVPPDKGT
jgi:hypothetical protein